MRFLKYSSRALFLMALLFVIGSCQEEEGTTLSQAVLASASALNFEGTDSAPQIITVYADAEWVSEVPEWITISPTSGSGVMDVTVSVNDNIRDGALDNPRKEVIVFKGETLASRAEVIVMQAGDKYRDVRDYTLQELVALEDETVVSVSDVMVMAVTSAGFIISDEQNVHNAYVLSETTVNIGDKVSILGDKASNSQSLAIIEADQTEIVSTGGSVTYPEAKDVTDGVDTYNATSREFIVVSGIMNGSNVSVSGANYTVSITDAPSSLDLEALNGHRVVVKGYFDGLAAPVIKILVAEIQDNGIAKDIYFFEDFEWLDPWSVVGNAGQTVETDNLSATAPRIPTPKIDGVSALDALLEKGYEFLRVTTKTPGECIYLQQNYLKFGKTSYQAGIILPNLAEDIPSSASPVMSFDWCPMRQGSGKIDPVNLIVIITNGTDEVTFDIPEAGFENGHRLEWIRAEVDLSGITITKETKITIRQTNWQIATANRYFLDNIEISSLAN
ncbi:MAG: BACON domain-containing protein [Bacteroidales bacterium]|nr:BACON domain-containing protein [Bacteroidales bacterium]